MDIAHFALANRAAYHAANEYLYCRIVLDEHPSPHIPWFRRRLYRLAHTLTKRNALRVRHADFSHNADISEKYLLSILKRCTNLTSLCLPASMQPVRNPIETQGMLVKGPVFLTPALSIPIYASITSLMWTGPFIPLRGPADYAGRDALRLFRNLRSLIIIYRPDSFVGDQSVKCSNVYLTTVEGAQSLTEDLEHMASACPLLEELVLPFWEPVYSLAGMVPYKRFSALRKIRFLVLDGPMKDIDWGRGFLKFVFEMSRIGIHVSFANPWQSHFHILCLVDEIGDVITETLRQIPSDQDLIFGPIGPPRNTWRGTGDVLNRLEWIAYDENVNAKMVLRWPISTFEQPPFIVPPIFTMIEFRFSMPVRRGDAGPFLKFRHLISKATEITHLEQIRVEMECIDAFYLAFPLFMQFQGHRKLILHVKRHLLPQRKGWEAWWIHRQWKMRRRFQDVEQLSLEGLATEDIHVHPARLFEKIMVQIMFSGEKAVSEVLCVFNDRYARSGGVG